MTSDGWQPDTFSFSIEYQKDILSSFIQSPELYERIGRYVDPRYFETQELSYIYQAIKHFHDSYGGVPDKVSINEVLYEQLGEHESLAPIIDEIYSHPKISIPTYEFVADSVKRFIQAQSLKQAIVESIDDISDQSKYPEIRARIDKALVVASDLDDLGMDVYSRDEIVDRWAKRKEKTEIIRLSSGWNTFDEIFEGFGAGEIFSFMAPSHTGKSMYLHNCGVNLLLQKKNVLHVSLEMSEEVTALRYDMRLLGMTKKQLMEDENSTNKLKEVLKNRIGKLILKEFPANEKTPQDIAIHLDKVQGSLDIKIDALIVDYADILRSPSRYRDRRHELDEIYTHLRNVGVKYKIPVITATQFNRESLDRRDSGKILTESSIAESYGIYRILDAAVTINGTPVDVINHKQLVYVAKNREGMIGSTIPMYVDFTRALVREATTR